ncbi:MAG: hypothetical protein HYV27_08130 [Candidatus Hydrogenedentes bacterium]|nr:hypothetical protein [Candidatus Hydrogenedentota bacterium]
MKREVDAIASDIKSTFMRNYGAGLDDKVKLGLFQAAIESLRGTQAASPKAKREFVSLILDFMLSPGSISSWVFSGGQDRHDYVLNMPDNTTVIIEAKGCLDGNNTNIFQRPPQAEEFYIWSLCQNVGSDPRHNVWSGIHTRLGAELIHRKEKIDGLIVWDMLCGTVGRPCPKCIGHPEKLISLPGKSVPSPCLYIFPRTIPDPRNNSKPDVARMADLKFFQALAALFGCDKADINEVSIQVRMEDANLQRKTTVRRDGEVVSESNWATLRRANK